MLYLTIFVSDALTCLLAESGIALTIIGTTFFRNFAGFACTVDVWDAWPLVAVYEDNDWIHNVSEGHPQRGLGTPRITMVVLVMCRRAFSSRTTTSTGSTG